MLSCQSKRMILLIVVFFNYPAKILNSYLNKVSCLKNRLTCCAENRILRKKIRFYFE